MDRHVMFFGFLLALMIFIHGDDAKAISNRHPVWLQGLKPLVRHERDLPPEELMENVTLASGGDYDVCNDVYRCHYEEEYGDFYPKLGKFLIREFYENLNSWCAPHNNCWDDNCESEELKFGLESNQRVIDWACSHREAFRDTACYQDPFPQRMEACVMVHQQAFEKEFDPLSSVEEVTACVVQALDELPGCSRENGFADFFRFAMAEMKRKYQL